MKRACGLLRAGSRPPGKTYARVVRGRGPIYSWRRLSAVLTHTILPSFTMLAASSSSLYAFVLLGTVVYLLNWLKEVKVNVSRRRGSRGVADLSSTVQEGSRAWPNSAPAVVLGRLEVSA